MREVLLAEKGYDTNAILEYTKEHGITAVIPPKCNRKVQKNTTRTYISCVFWLKTPSFTSSVGEVLLLVTSKMPLLAAIHIRCIALTISAS